jgi:hypothetical protein
MICVSVSLAPNAPDWYVALPAYYTHQVGGLSSPNLAIVVGDPGGEKSSTMWAEDSMPAPAWKSQCWVEILHSTACSRRCCAGVNAC